MIEFTTTSGLQVFVNPRYLHQVVQDDTQANASIIVTEYENYVVDDTMARQVIQNMTHFLIKHT